VAIAIESNLPISNSRLVASCRRLTVVKIITTVISAQAGMMLKNWLNISDTQKKNPAMHQARRDFSTPALRKPGFFSARW
jgi:hypothetical protein